MWRTKYPFSRFFMTVVAVVVNAGVNGQYSASKHTLTLPFSHSLDCSLVFCSAVVRGLLALPRNCVCVMLWVCWLWMLSENLNLPLVNLFVCFMALLFNCGSYSTWFRGSISVSYSAISLFLVCVVFRLCSRFSLWL